MPIYECLITAKVIRNFRLFLIGAKERINPNILIPNTHNKEIVYSLDIDIVNVKKNLHINYSALKV